MEIGDTLKFVKTLRASKNRYLASMMDELEQVLDPNTPEFEKARKVILDHFNDYHRAVFRTVLGIDVEGHRYL